jgi:inner membrane protein
VPTIISHAFVGLAVAKAFGPSDAPVGFYLASVACSVLPDADVLSFHFGIPYHHIFGHRGFFHSLCLALMMSVLITTTLFRDVEVFSRRSLFHFLFFFLLTASHGILDGLTDGGLGIALLSPFDNERYFFPWTPIKVSPIGIKAFFSHWGYMVMKSELLWVWLPCTLLMGISALIRAMATRLQR